MPDDLQLAARLLAYEQGRAVRIAACRRVSIEPDALVFCPIAMAGEDTATHIVACGGIGERAQIFSVADPRIGAEHYGLIEWLSQIVEERFQRARRNERFPQLWVASSAVVTYVDVLAERLRFNRENARAQRLGELLTYFGDRAPYRGQQALVTATDALSQHFATGQQPGEDQHLGTVLAWIAPPAGQDIMASVAAAEAQPMGLKTDPGFDELTLFPLVQSYNEARRAGAPDRELRRRADAIRAALQPIVVNVYSATQRAIEILARNALPPLPDLAALRSREAEEFESFMRSRDEGYRLPKRDRPKAAAFKIAALEDAEQNYEAALVRGDAMARAGARLDGRVLTGRVENRRRIRLAPRRFESSFELVSEQPGLRVRRRDELCLVADPRLRVLVTAVRREGGRARVSVTILQGQRAVGLPPTGATLDLANGTPQWDRYIRQRVQMAKRLRETPWTHSAGDIPPPVPSGRLPADPLAAVDALRAR